MSPGLAQTLAAYFGDEDAVPEGMCKSCTFCLTGAGTTFDPKFNTIADPVKVRAVLAACPDRDDPRLLARLAFGISSPRLTMNKLGKHAVFGSMVDTDFRVLLEVFIKACEAGGGQKAPPPPSPPSKKRSYSQASGSRGTSAKRGRYN